MDRPRLDIDRHIREAKTIALAGHIRPDGDAVGSYLGMYLFIQKYYPDKKVRLYLEHVPETFMFLHGADEVCTNAREGIHYDLFITLDCSDLARLGDNGIYFKLARHTVCIDHHVTNGSFADENYIVPEASSTCELVCDLLGMDRIDHDMAEALYMGMAHDTGVFQYSCTSSHTMVLAGQLMDKGIDYSRIVADTYFVKSYFQQQILGRALLESIRMLDGRVIFSAVKRKDMEFFCVTPKDMDGIVSVLKNTRGAEVAIFLYELKPQEWKVSLRSGEAVDVAQIGAFFEGGGHKRAAGCTMQGSMHDVINNLMEHVEEQLTKQDADENVEWTES